MFLLGVLVKPSYSFTGKIGLLVRLHGVDGNFMGVSRQRVAAAGVLAVKHINERNSVLVPSSDELHPDFSLDYEIADTFSTPGRGVQLSIEFQQAGYHPPKSFSMSLVLTQILPLAGSSILSELHGQLSLRRYLSWHQQTISL